MYAQINITKENSDGSNEHFCMGTVRKYKGKRGFIASDAYYTITYVLCDSTIETHKDEVFGYGLQSEYPFDFNQEKIINFTEGLTVNMRELVFVISNLDWSKNK